MKPIKLILTAFGPYADTQEIDFTKLNNRNIFLITGPTGAGKTTIFDGISYAIYGEASGDGRNGENLRSQFAGINILTSVELYFELRNKKYYIKRIPKQMKPKSRGQGFTEQKTDAEMKVFDENGEYKVISGVNEVNEKVYQIIGINYQQFKQIMMIPQGEFRKLLVSDSKEKEKILQKIFNTEIYNRFEFKLIEMANCIQKHIKELNDKKFENINRIQYKKNSLMEEALNKEHKDDEKILELLKNEIGTENSLLDNLMDNILKISQKIEITQKNIYKTMEDNKKIDEKTILEDKLKILEEKKLDIILKEKKLLKGRKTLKIRPIAENYLSRKEEVNHKEVQLRENIGNLKSAEDELKQAKHNLDCENLKEDRRNNIAETLSKLKSYREKVREIETQNNRLNISSNELNKIKSTREDKKIFILKLKEDIELSRNNLEELRNLKEKYLEFKTKQDKLNNINNIATNLYSENRQLSKIRLLYMKYKKSMNDQKEIFDNESDNLKNMEKLFRNGQAAFLASGLKEGEPCPVCGSIHHITYARVETEFPTEDEIETHRKLVEKEKKKYDEVSTKFQDIDVDGRSKSSIIDRLKNDYYVLTGENIKELVKEKLTVFIEEKLEKLEIELKNIQNNIKETQNKVNSIDKINNKLNKQVLQYENENKIFENINQEYSNKLIEVEKIKGILQQISSDVPEDLRIKEKLENTIVKTENRQNEMINALKIMEDNYQNCMIKYEKILSENNSMEKNLQNEKIYLTQMEESLKMAMNELGFSDIADYNNSRITDDEENRLNFEINDFYKEVKSINDRYSAISEEVKNLTILNVDELKENCELIKKHKNQLEEEKGKITTRLEINKFLLDRLLDLVSKIKKNEAKYGIVGDLAEASKGQNYERISFERYVLSAFFEDIVEAANLRFIKMTHSRYELSRITQRSKGRTQSGLDLQVYDNYTGKYRHVKTLSGGESFKAALSLSLGLADIVQCYSGGISIDTMFIDEGFGTLDPESLDSAVQCLIDLQSSGRLVGIISHVPELKERIDAQLEIIPGTEGSRAQFNI